MKTQPMKFKNDMDNGMPASNDEELDNRMHDTGYMHGRPLGEEFHRHIGGEFSDSFRHRADEEYSHHAQRHEDPKEKEVVQHP